MPSSSRSADSRYDNFLRGEIKLDSEEERGRKLFMAHPDAKVSLRGGNCIDCHSQFLTGFNALYDGFSNNGLDGEEGLQPGLKENWEVGYKFVLFEGSLLVDGERRPLVYHVGFSENHRTLQFDLPEPSRMWSPQGLEFRVDLLTLFAGDQTVDMQMLPNVKFDRADAGLLADNYASMITLASPL